MFPYVGDNAPNPRALQRGVKKGGERWGEKESGNGGSNALLLSILQPDIEKLASLREARPSH